MNEIQDIVLESEYNVLLALSEYYDKQLVLESYYMEATGGISPAAAPDIIQRFINWCLKMISNIQNKSRQVPPRTPLPPAITRQAETVVQAANEYSDAANNGSSPEQVSQQMADINNRVNAANNDQQNANNNNQSTMTVENLNDATKKVQQTIDQINNNIQQMEDIAGQAQDAANQEKIKAEKEKLKTGGGILKRLNELITTLTTPVTSIEGEPISDLKGYSNNIIESIKKATTEQDAQKTYEKAIETYKKLTKFYKDKLINGPVKPKEADYCKTQVQKIQQWENGVKQVYEECIAKLKNGGGGQQQPTPETSQPQKGPRVSPEAQNILNDINGAQQPAPQNNPPQPQPTNDNNGQTNPQTQQNSQAKKPPLTEEQKATIEQLKAYSWKPPTPPSGGDLWSYIDSLNFDTAANYVKPMLADIDKKLEYLNNYKTDDPRIEGAVKHNKLWLRKMGDQLVFSVNDLHKDTDSAPLLNNPYTSNPQPQQNNPSQQQKGPRVSPEAQNILNDINGSQQSQQQTNGSMNGQQLFQFVQQLRNNSNHEYRDYNTDVNRLDYSANPNALYIVDKSSYNVYPNAVSDMKTLSLSPNIFNSSIKRIDANSSIAPAKIDTTGNIIQQGTIS